MVDFFTGSAAPSRPPRGVQVIDTETLIRAPLDRVFDFFTDAGNLERLTPSWLRFAIDSPRPIAMGKGTLIDYRLSVRGLPIRWRTRIEVWEPGRRFVDAQISGPYLWWVHEHTFTPIDDGVLVRDRVEYVPRFRWLTSWLVRRDVERIFRFRADQLQKIFDRDRDGSP